MTSALETIRYHSGIAGEEVADMVDSLEREVSSLREQVEKLTKERDAEIARNRPLQSLIKLTEETKSFLLKKSEENKEAVKQLDSERQANALLTEELTAIAEQNEKLRKVLLRLACLGNGDQYGNSIGNCIAQEALSLPDLASPVLNSIPKEPTLPVFDADSPRFRQVFDEAVQAHNLPGKRKGEGYRSPITQWCFEIAYSVVNRLRLYEK